MMQRLVPALLALQLTTAVSLAAAPRQEQEAPRVKLWFADARDAFAIGERTRIFVRPSASGYVSVLRIDASGNLEAVFPSNASQDSYLEGGRAYALPAPGGGTSWAMNGAPGLAYLFAVASSRPLNVRAIGPLFRASRGSNDVRVVYGDPFAAMDRVAVALAGANRREFALAWISYQLGGRFEWPRYACYDAYGSWYYGRTAQYESCNRVRTVLRDEPHYYDTRGPRITAERFRAGSQPEYGYKLREGVPARDLSRRATAPLVPPQRERTAPEERKDPPAPRPTLTRRPPLPDAPIEKPSAPRTRPGARERQGGAHPARPLPA